MWGFPWCCCSCDTFCANIPMPSAVFVQFGNSGQCPPLDGQVIQLNSQGFSHHTYAGIPNDCFLWSSKDLQTATGCPFGIIWGCCSGSPNPFLCIVDPVGVNATFCWNTFQLNSCSPLNVSYLQTVQFAITQNGRCTICTLPAGSTARVTA